MNFHCFRFRVKIDVCSATSMESSRRDLLNNVAKNRHILKNDQNTNYTRFSFILKTGIELHTTDVSFILSTFHLASMSFR